jgi:hypothetical protein
LVALSLTCPLWAQALTPSFYEPPLGSLIQVAVGPQEATESAQPLPLREVVRPSPRGADAPGKPFRLSAEERRRLREQLRNQSAQGRNTP